MKRKQFLKRTSALLPLILGRFPLSVMSNSVWSSLLSANKYQGRVLVLIQLDGGNDGLNTVIPLDKYSNLIKVRKDILISEKKVLSLNGAADTGFHPALSGLRELYNDRIVTCVQGVGYPGTDRSHSRSTDIWMSGTDAPFSVTGWLARFLEKDYSSYPVGFPNTDNPDPLAIRIGSVGPKITTGLIEDFGTVVSPSTINNQPTPTMYPDSLPNTSAGMAVHSIREMNRLSEVYAPVIKTASDGQRNLSKKYPADGENTLADQLKIVARLIGGGLRTQLYVLTQRGYDTHAGQVETSDPTAGTHSKLLEKLSEAISAFQDDIHLMGKHEEVVGMTFSEFGRRISANGSFGTDHGSSQPIILFGSKLKGGFIGKNPEIPAQVGYDDNLLMQYDFRSVYSSILKGWFGNSEAQISKIITGEYPYLDLFKS